MKKFISFWASKVKKYWRKNMYSLLALVFIVSNIFVGLQAIDPSVDPRNHYTGAKPLSEKQIADIKKNWPRVLGVNPNKYGAARIQASMKEKGIALRGIEAISDGQEEFITNKNSDLDENSPIMKASALPSKVDNSKLACFPPIGNQQQQGSCVGWASTYYHATHEYGLLNGINNKTSTKNIRSPKWTYNMINLGNDGGSFPTDAYELLKKNGAPAFNDFPYDTNYREWDLKTQDWISALFYRMNDPLFITINGPNDIDVVKQILNNGHIVTFTTFINSWQFTKVSADPSQASNPYAGQWAVSWMNGNAGGHHTTIVGYDDDIWIDVNGNRQVDAGEKGAFLIANSWGTGWGNNGFMWVSYDAFYKSSRVVGGPSYNRLPAADMLFSITPKSLNYTPKAVAKFSLSQTIRKELKVSLGVSDTNATTPSKKFISGALTTDGGSFAFDGQYPHLQTATFALDATDLLPATVTPQKYYLIVEDTTAGNTTTLNSYSVVDLTNNKETSLKDVPVRVDRGVIQPNVIFQQSQDILPPATPVINITYPTSLATINGSISVTANVSENVKVAKVEMYVNSKLSSVDLTAPFVLPLDTTKLANGQYTITAVVYDDAGHTANDNVIVNVQNTESDELPAYLSYQQKKASVWNGGAQYNCTLKNQGTTAITDLKIKYLVPSKNIYVYNVTIVSSDHQSVTIGLPYWKRSLEPDETFSFGFVIQPDEEPRVSFVSATQG